MTATSAPAPHWPVLADRFTITELASLTGVRRSNLSGYRSGRIAASDAVLDSVEAVAALPDESLLVRPAYCTWPRLGRVLRDVVATDPSLGVRLVKQSFEHATKTVTNAAEARVFFGRPPRTGSTEWDALIAGAADTAFYELGYGTSLPWTGAARLYLPAPWSPFGSYGLRPFSLLRTPIQLRERNVIVNRGEFSWV